ncbi:hypothetical protein KBX71_07690 [Micromonospora sp. D93]|uniref:hypothetical protein n=1 Tax=Micromonospora sp. D93 TaxID=2824886 RepID=UPI001B36AFC5|nr:hypothetical protein [Micromonospora sp. D93]MBQ1017751.1 hypothetical protein [Micromonospora sp. D93]
MAFPLTELPVTTELFIGGGVGWSDISTDVRLSSADSGGGISIKHGEADGGGSEQSSAGLTLNNRSGKYAPRNPRGPWYKLFGRNTPIRVGVELAADPLNRIVGAGWGSSPDGRSWTNFGGPDVDYYANGTEGRHSQPVKNLAHISYLDRNWQDVEQLSQVVAPTVASGGAANVGHVARLNPTTNTYYWMRLSYETSGALGAQFFKRVNGSLGGIPGSITVPGLTYTGGQRLWLRSGVCGNRLSLKVWADGTPEPPEWTVTVTDVDITAPGRAGCISRAETGNTNTAELRFESYQAIDRRFHGEVASWPLEWDLGEFDHWVPISAAGIIRRLGQGTPSTHSALRRAYGASGPVGYWPLEDGRASAQAASAIPGHVPATITGPGAEFVDVADFVWGRGDPLTIRYGTGKILELKGGASVRAVTPHITAATRTAWTVAVVGNPDPDGTVGDPMIILEVETPAAPVYQRWQLIQREGAGGGLFGLQLVAINSAGVGTVVATSSGLYLSFQQYDISVWQDGGTIRASLFGGSATGAISGTMSGVTAVTINRSSTTSTNESMPFGHLAVWSTQVLPSQLAIIQTDGYGHEVFGPMASWWQEAATDRLVRLAREEGVPLSMPAVPEWAVQRMGWQAPGTFLELIRACADADRGLLFEARDGLGLVYRPRHTLYNQTPVRVSYPGGQVSAPFVPLDDDLVTRNDITLTRTEGSSFRAVETMGPLAAVPPPAGVGVIETSMELNLLADSQLPDRANWELHIGTVDEPRYPAIRIDLSARGWTSDPELSAQAAAVGPGDLAELVGLPAWLPRQAAKVLVGGYTERLDAFDRDIVWNGMPGSAWNVGFADGTTRAGANGTTVAIAIGATDLILPLDNPAANGPWTTNPAHYPLDVRVGNERILAQSVGLVANPNPWFVSNLNDWVPLNTTIAWVAAGRPGTGTGAARITPDGVTAVGGMHSSPVAVNPSTEYRFAMMAYAEVGTLSTNIAADWQTGGGGTISTSFGPMVTLVPGVWTPLSVTFTSPATAGQVVMRARYVGTPPSSSTWKCATFTIAPETTASGIGAYQRLALAPGDRGVDGRAESWSVGTEVDLWEPRVSPL